MSVERQPHWPPRIGYAAAFKAGFEAQRGDTNPYAKAEYTWEEANGRCYHHYSREVEGWEAGTLHAARGGRLPAWDFTPKP